MSIPFRTDLKLVNGEQDGDFQKIWTVEGNVTHTPAGPVIEFEEVSLIMEHYPVKVDGKYPRLRRDWSFVPVRSETALLEWLADRTSDDREDWKDQILEIVRDKYDEEEPIASVANLTPIAVKRLTHPPAVLAGVE